MEVNKNQAGHVIVQTKNFKPKPQTVVVNTTQSISQRSLWSTRYREILGITLSVFTGEVIYPAHYLHI